MEGLRVFPLWLKKLQISVHVRCQGRNYTTFLIKQPNNRVCRRSKYVCMYKDKRAMCMCIIFLDEHLDVYIYVFLIHIFILFIAYNSFLTVLAQDGSRKRGCCY